MKLIKSLLICTLCWIPIVIVSAIIKVYEIKPYVLSIQLCSFWCGMAYQYLLDKNKIYSIGNK